MQMYKFYCRDSNRVRSCISINFLWTMKLIIVLLITSFVQASATSHAQLISINKKDTSLKEIFRDINQQTGYSFIISSELVNEFESVTINVKNATIQEVLDKCFVGQPVTYVINKRTIVVSETLITPKVEIPPPVLITGKVTDEKSEPLPGVNVLVKGTTTGTITDAEGNYSLDITEENTVLVFSYTGFLTQEVRVNDQSIINVKLLPHVKSLEEVVVIGYGQEQQRDLTGAVSSVSADEIMNTHFDSPEKVLQGKVPGVHLVNNSGQPGAATTMRIRGGASVNAGNLPLFVIDGIPFSMESEGSSSGVTQGAAVNPLSMINSDDIASISVLKDASAAAIYGSRGSNGVVLITTKNGRSGEPTFNFSTRTGFQNVRKKLEVLNAQQFALIRNEAQINSGDSPIYTDEQIASFGAGTDWQDEIFRSGTIQEYDLSVSGGSEDTQYYVSAGYFLNEGILIGSDFQNYNLRLNLSTKVLDRVRIGDNFTLSRINTNLVRSSTGSGSSNAGVVAAAIHMNPILPITNPDGSYVLRNDAGIDYPNPVASARELTNEAKTTRFVNNLFVEIDLTRRLKFRSSIGVNLLNNQEVYFKPNTIFLGGTERNEARRGNLNSEYWINENTLEYKTSFGGESTPQTFTLLGGFTMEGRNDESTFAGSFNFPNNSLEAYDLSAGSEFLTPQSATDSYNLVSYLGRVNYTIDDRYLFTATARVDGSSRFGRNNKYGFFPSGAIAWRLSSEEFLRESDFFSDLKLRVSFGKTGNQSIGSYQSLQLLNSTGAILGDQVAIGFAPVNLGNPDLKWESTTQLNIGTDISILDGKISLTADYYNKITNDLLFNVPLPASSGFSTTLVNLGEIQNTGIELGISTNAISLGEAIWNLGFNIASNRNEILDLGGLEQFSVGQEISRGTGNTLLIKEGEPLGTFYGRVFQGMSSDGKILYEDLDGDGEITDDGDRRILGDALPDFTAGFNSNLYFKNFEFSIGLNGVFGNDIFNVNRVELDLPNGYQNNSINVLNRWRSDNQNTTIPAAKAAASEVVFDDRFLEDGSYLRFQNITLAYNLPTDLLQKVNIRNLRVYVSGENLITITDYSGFDPEANAFGQDNLNQGIDFGVYPTAKTFSVGLQLGL